MSSTGVRRVSEARWIGFEKEVLMLIRIACPDKWRDQRQVIQRKSFIVPLAGNPKASYTDNKANPRILCGSI